MKNTNCSLFPTFLLTFFNFLKLDISVEGLCHILKLPVPNCQLLLLVLLPFFQLVRTSSCILQMFTWHTDPIIIFFQCHLLTLSSKPYPLYHPHIQPATEYCSRYCTMPLKSTYLHSLFLYVNLAGYHLLLDYCNDYLHFFLSHSCILDVLWKIQPEQ